MASTVTGMLRTLEVGGSRPYRVPWLVDRSTAAHPLITNSGAEPADFVRVFTSEGRTDHWGQLLPGESAQLCLCEVDLDAVVVTLCWFRPSTGIEYVWRFVL